MCIIIYKPEGIALFPETIANSFDNNPHGAGFAYVEDGKVHVQKGFFTLPAFMEAYTPHEKKQTMLHFRIRTHGNLEEENCHPFHVTTNLVFAHNGTLYKMPVDKEKSDTVQFNELILKNLVRIYGKRLMYDKSFLQVLEGYSYSKFCFLDNQGNFAIVNEKDGHWNSKCWFSNDSYKNPKPKYEYNPREAYQHYHGTQGTLPIDQQTPQLTKWQRKQKKKQDKLDKLLQVVSNNPTLALPPPGVIKPFVLNDYVRLNNHHGLAEPGWLGRIMGFYQNGDMDVYFPLRMMSKRCSPVLLDPVAVSVIPPSTTQIYED